MPYKFVNNFNAFDAIYNYNLCQIRVKLTRGSDLPPSASICRSILRRRTKRVRLMRFLLKKQKTPAFLWPWKSCRN